MRYLLRTQITQRCCNSSPKPSCSDFALTRPPNIRRELLSSVFTFEMLLGRVIAEGGDPATAVALLQTFQSTEVFLAILPGLLTFFVGTSCFVVSLSARADPFRWPALGFAVGAALILGEIILAEVLLSQVGNIVILMAGTSFAWLLLQRDVTASR